MHRKWFQSGNELRRGRWSVVLSDAVILAVGCRNAGKRGKGARGSPSLQHPTSCMLWSPPTALLQIDLWQNGRTPHSLLLPHYRRNRGRQQHDTSVTSSGENQGTCFEDPLNAPVKYELQALWSKQGVHSRRETTLWCNTGRSNVAKSSRPAMAGARPVAELRSLPRRAPWNARETSLPPFESTP